jgi:DNA-binding winged helix-turn-helix (wHTH) protein
LPESQVLFGNSLGNLDPDILLVNRNCESWVTDFTQSGPAPIWFDFIDMENHIRFSLMDIDDLFRLYEFEKQLMSMQRLSEIIPPGDVDTEDRKALNAIQTVRHMAASFFSDELIPYYIGLLFCSAKGFETYDHDVRETKRRTLSTIHRLLFSAMLCQHFAQISEHLSQNDVIENVHPIHIDEENKEVSIGERVITLTPTEYGLFLYLYNHAEKLCQREKLLSNVFNYQDLDPVAGKSLLNTHISRLRHKIESDPSNPKYILTIRGRGYKLKILPE